MSSVVIAGNTSGSVTLSAPNVAGTTTITLPSTSGTMATTTALGGDSTTTTSSSNLTLTSSSNRVQYVSLTNSSNNNVILPDATTLSKGGPVFVIVNSGYNVINIKNSSSGYVIYTLGQGQSALLFLTDNSTADGIWATQNGDIIYGFGPTTTVATNSGFSNYELGGNSYGLSVSALSSTSAIITYSNTSSVLGSLYGVVVTISGTTVTAGTPTLIYTGTATGLDDWKVVGLSSTTAMVFISRGNTTASSICYGLTISGTTLSVSTASATFGSSGYVDGAVAMNSTQVLAVYGSTNSATWVCAVFVHNGASAPTVGTASASWSSSRAATSVGTITYLTATTAFWVLNTSGGYNSARVVTISGTSAPTLGTAVQPTNAGLFSLTYYGYCPTAYAISATEVVVFGPNGSDRWTVSGTTVTYGSYSPYTTLNFPGVKVGTPGFMMTGSVNGSIGFYPVWNVPYIALLKFVSGQPALPLGQILPLSTGTVNSGACTLDSTTGLYVSSYGGTSNIVAQVIKLIGP